VTTAIDPGSFDPLTFGHVDIVERSARLFDNVIVAILTNSQKAPLFTVDERIEIMREILKPRFPNVEVDVFHGLLVDYAKQKLVIVRGFAPYRLRIQFQMALMNRRLTPDVNGVLDAG
jgi:pantetheine-phosphate adenylyltransferase